MHDPCNLEDGPQQPNDFGVRKSDQLIKNRKVKMH